MRDLVLPCRKMVLNVYIWLCTGFMEAMLCSEWPSVAQARASDVHQTDAPGWLLSQAAVSFAYQ